MDFLGLVEKEVHRRLNDGLRPQQREVLQALANGQNVFAGLPTGYGKSLCYWAPAAAWGWRVWVVSPLVSLIQDQAMACADLGLPVVAWTGAGSPAGYRRLWAMMEDSEPKIVFLSPERLAQWQEEGKIAKLTDLGFEPNLVALDEMHCLEDWRSFRQGYRDSFAPIRRFVSRGIPLLGLSASFSCRDASAWMAELGASYRYVGSGLGRENLVLRILPIETEGERWLRLAIALRESPPGEAALVYCASRSEADDVSRWLQSAGIPACAYHAGLSAQLRAARSKAFRRGILPVVCATSAFGMGIDYPGVRKVVHFSLPYSLEAYWQEAGRAGRDGKQAYALAFWRRSEIARANDLLPMERERYASLWRAWARGNCRKRAVAEQFGLEAEDCGHCDRCAPANATLPTWLRDAEMEVRGSPWWMDPAAYLSDWVERKFSGSREKS